MGGFGVCPLPNECAGITWHVTMVVLHYEYLYNCFVGIEEGLMDRRGERMRARVGERERERE